MQKENEILDEVLLLEAVNNLYTLKRPISCKFIRRSFNDHYIIESDQGRFILRVYINNKNYLKNIEDIFFEMDLLSYLKLKGLSVISAIKNKDNQKVSFLEIGEETRYLVLFPFAEGSPIEENLSQSQSIEMGKMIANLHKHSNGFTSDHFRYTLDTYHLIDMPLKLIGDYAKYFNIGNLTFFSNYAKKLKESLNAILMNNETFGIIHGDPNPSNFYYSSNQGFSLFDFDHCAYGYRIHDLAVIQLSYPENVSRFILDGYEQIRQLEKNEKNSIDLYSNILLIRKFADILNMLEITNSEESRKQETTKNAFQLLKDIVERE